MFWVIVWSIKAYHCFSTNFIRCRSQSGSSSACVFCRAVADSGILLWRMRSLLLPSLLPLASAASSWTLYYWRTAVTTRVVTSEISGGKFPEIYSNLSENFWKFVNYLCQSAVFKSTVAKWCCKISACFDKQLFSSLCFKLMHYVKKK